jgi:hypothetical protein
MSSRSPAETGTLNIRDLETKSRREADKLREQEEAQGFNQHRRWRRKNGRTEFLALRTSPEIKRMIVSMADAEEKHLIEVIEDAIRTRFEALKGVRPVRQD